MASTEEQFNQENAALEARLAELRNRVGVMTPAPAAPAPGQLQSLLSTPTRNPTDVELGVAQLRQMPELDQAVADLAGRKLLTQESATLTASPAEANM